jgi:CheY-like chemotaxis protein
MEAGSTNMNTSLSIRRRERLSVRTALESAGFLVFDLSKAGRDRDRLRQFWAAVILFDVPMSRLGGLEVVERLRRAGDNVPDAIVVTHGRIPDALTAVRLGVADVRAKPLMPEVLHAVVEEIDRRVAGTWTGPAQPRILFAVEPMVLDLLRAKGALDRQEFDEAERLVRKAIDRDPCSAVAHNLMGVLQLRLGEHHAAYRSFRAALSADRDHEPARENLRRHCDRFGPEFHLDGCPP